MSDAGDAARLEAAGLDPDDVAARFTEWVTQEGITPAGFPGADAIAADMARAFGAGYAARHVESPDSFGPPGAGSTIGIAAEVSSDDLAAFLGRVPDVQADTIGRVLVNIARYLPQGIRARVRVTYRADDEIRARGRIEIPPTPPFLE